MADTATISVITAGTVGVLGAGLGALNPWFTRKNQQDERFEGRRDDFRVVLDEAAGVLATAIGRVFEDVPPNMVAVLTEAISDVRAHSARLGIRVGPRDDIYLRYNDALLGLVHLSLSMRNGNLDSQIFDSIRSHVEPAYVAFQEAASDRVGVRR